MRARSLVLLTLLLLARGESPLTAALGPRYGGQLAVGVLELPASLEPRDALGRDEGLVQGLVHETLLRIGSDGSPAPALALRWASSAEGREWSLWLRPGLRFHDGSPLLAQDAVRSIRRFVRGSSLLAPAFAEELEGGAAFRAGATPELTGASAPAPDHVLLRFNSARGLPFAPLAAPAAAVTSAEGAGAGPFVPNLNVPGRRLALVPFSGHWAGRPYLDAVDLRVAASAEALGADFEAGRLDVGPGGPGVGRVASTLVLALDPSPPFDGAPARAAVDAALDRMELPRLLAGADPSRVVLPPALLPPLPPGPRAVPGAHLDAELALAVERDVPALVSQRVVALLAELGVRTRVVPVSPAAILRAKGSRLFAWSPQVAEASLALRELAALVSAPAPVLEALAAAAEEPDADRRRVRLHQAEAALRETGLLLPLGLAPVTAGVRPGVHGVTVDDTGRLRLEDAWTEP